jgi:hypothetical protein
VNRDDKVTLSIAEIAAMMTMAHFDADSDPAAFSSEPLGFLNNPHHALYYEKAVKLVTELTKKEAAA